MVLLSGAERLDVRHDVRGLRELPFCEKSLLVFDDNRLSCVHCCLQFAISGLVPPFGAELPDIGNDAGNRGGVAAFGAFAANALKDQFCLACFENKTFVGQFANDSCALTFTDDKRVGGADGDTCHEENR